MLDSKETHVAQSQVKCINGSIYGTCMVHLQSVNGTLVYTEAVWCSGHCLFPLVTFYLGPVRNNY